MGRMKSYKNQLIPRGSYKDQEWVRNFLKKVLEKMGYKKVEDLYKISCKDITKYGEHNLTQKYRPAPYAIVQFAFPEFEWLPWKFRQISSDFWGDLGNLKWYLKWLSQKLNYKTHKDFYNITTQDFKKHSGSGLLSLHNESPTQILINAFPDYDWEPWLFLKIPKNFWDRAQNRIKYLKWLESKIGVNNPEDWYTVTKTEFEKNKGGGLLAMAYQGSPAKAAQELYPEMNWNLSEFGEKKQKQHRLYQIVSEIFQNISVLWDHKFEDSGTKISVDVFIPAYNLAFEYKKAKHFKNCESWKEWLAKNGITLIEIGYLWDGKRESMEANLLKWRDTHVIDSDDSNSSIVLNNRRIFNSSEIRNLSVSWRMRFFQLKAFKKTYGHCEVIEKDPNSQLAQWLKVQLKAKKQGLLNAQRIKLLEAIGVIWQNPEETRTWDEQFLRLNQYKEKTGHCNISQRCKEPAGLGVWAKKQRTLYNKKQLDKRKIEKLESIGFCWDPLKQLWSQRFQELESYKLKYGNCNVPQGWKENPSLAIWVFNLRRAKKKKRLATLTPERIEKLDALGFEWKVLEEAWLKFFEEFRRFKMANGHGRVPKGASLGNWLNRQKRSFKKGALSLNKQKMLHSVSDDWL